MEEIMNKVNDKKHTPIIVIIIAMIFFFPIGIYLIYKRMTDDKTEILKNSKTVKKLGWFLVFLGIVYAILYISGGFETESGEKVAEPLILMIVLFLGGGILTLRGSRKMRKRGEVYEKCLRNVNSNQRDISSIANNLSISHEETEKVLHEMINEGFFEDAHFDMINKKIVLPNSSFNDHYVRIQYKATNSSHVADSPRIKVVECPNCGADIESTEGFVTECEYCGSRINV